MRSQETRYVFILENSNLRAQQPPWREYCHPTQDRVTTYAATHAFSSSDRSEPRIGGLL